MAWGLCDHTGLEVRFGKGPECQIPVARSARAALGKMGLMEGLNSAGSGHPPPGQKPGAWTDM